MEKEQIEPNDLATANGRRTAQPSPVMSAALQGVTVLRLVEGLNVTTRGQGAADLVKYPIGPTFKGIMMRAQDIVLHGFCRDASSANLSWEIDVEWSYDGETWNSATVLTTQTGNGYHISAAYTDRTTFGALVRFKLVVKDAGTVERGTLWVDLAIHFLS